MARSAAQTNQLVQRALKSDSKSDGMRMLLEAGMTVAEIKEALGVPYGFAYGVATRWAAATGNLIPVSAREAKPKAAKAAKPAARAKATTRAKAPARTAKTSASKSKSTKARAKA